MIFTITKTTFYPFADADEEVYDTIEADSFEAAKDTVKAGADIFKTIPNIIEENENYLEFKIDRGRYINCRFSMSNNISENNIKYIRFKFYSKIWKYRAIYTVLTNDKFILYPIYEIEIAYLHQIDLAIPKREGAYVVVFGRNERKLVFCINDTFYIYDNYSEPLWADNEKAINPIIYVNDYYLNEKGKEEKQYELQFKELIENNQRLVYKANFGQRLLFHKRNKKVGEIKGKGL